ncbi:MAG: autotransporter outer membrane beta-barrel domain-containing protein [Chlamydiales bacterium]|nr:autotransporter outer membrane beta-barrel domain-containing protein [Chlamydiales bacterium]
MKKLLMIISASISLSLCAADFGNAIIGGQDFDIVNNFGYVALIDPNGTVTQVPITADNVNSVAINDAGTALIGGDGVTAALISSSGVVQPLTPIPVNTTILKVGINQSGYGVISGSVPNGACFAALVSPSGTLTSISSPNFPNTVGSMSGAGINDAGTAIIAGDNTTIGIPYAALVSPSGTATEVTGMPASAVLTSADIGNLGTGIVAGKQTGDAYAAFVAPDATSDEISLPGLGVTPELLDAAINNLGYAIVGGQTTTPSGNAFAALVAPDKTVTSLLGATFANSQIESVDINDAGTAIIGGGQRNNAGPPIALLAAPDGTLTSLSPLPSDVIFIKGVAINQAGVGIIGGERTALPAAYAALVAPDGTLTELSPFPSFGYILTVAINDLLLDSVVPKSIGPGNFPGIVSLALSENLSTHLSSILNDPSCSRVPASDSQTNSKTACPSCRPRSNYALWASPLFYHAHQKKEGKLPSMTDWSGGVITGFDYYGIQNAVIGTGAAYTYSHVHLGNGKGYANINQEFLTFYSAWARQNFYIDFSLWGGLYQVKNKRHSIADITSTANIHGWLLTPHLEVSFPFHAKKCWLLIDPFVMFDWVNNWQGHIHEKGGSGFNLIIGHQYTSLLKTEAGLRFSESLPFGWGTLVLMEKASWINKVAFHTDPAKAIFVSGNASFPVEMFNGKTQNLGALQFSSLFVPSSTKYPYGSINYQGEFGTSFQSHTVFFEIGKNF